MNASARILKASHLRLHSRIIPSLPLHSPSSNALLCHYFSTTTSSFPFSPSKTSGRREKRLQRKRRLQLKVREERQKQQPATAYDHDWDDNGEADNRTWRTILFPPIYAPGEPRPPGMDWPKSPKELYLVVREAWSLYKESWSGFFSNHDTTTTNKKDSLTAAIPTAQEIQANVERNLKVSRAEGEKLTKELQERTGIYNMEDAKAMVREMMIVATNMLTEFMREYRKGRDEEIDKMMNEYFQEVEEKDTSTEEKEKKGEEEETERKQKRRRKRRIPVLLQ